jgi:signal peptidase I
MLNLKGDMSFPPGYTPASPDEPRETPEPSPYLGPPPQAVALSADDAPAYDWPAEPPPRKRVLKRIGHLGVELVQTLILAALLFLAVRAMAQNFRVEGSSMEPGLHNGQYLLVNKAIYFKVNLKTLSKYVPFIHPGDNPEHFIFRAPHRGDVVVFRFPRDPNRDFIKRIIGVPGDTVQVDNGAVVVNGVRLSEPYVLNDTGRTEEKAQTVPPHQYFVLGDNRNNSSDSRSWGFVPEKNIIGQAMVSYWPLDKLGGVGNKHISLTIGSLPIPAWW